MATFKRFEDIEAWKLARIVARQIHELTEVIAIKRDYPLKDQMGRSSGSMMDNIAEGFGRNSQFEFVQFLSIGQGSASELKSQLYRALDFEYIDQKTFDSFSEMIERYGKMAGGLVEYLNQSNIRGVKFKDRVSN